MKEFMEIRRRNEIDFLCVSRENWSLTFVVRTVQRIVVFKCSQPFHSPVCFASTENLFG